MKHTHKIHGIFAALLLVGILGTSCTSPLDTDANRKETPITPAPKVTPSSYKVEFSTAYGSMVVKGLPTIKIDTAASPMRFWFDITMESIDTVGKSPLMHGFRLRLDSAAGDGMIVPLVTGQVQILADFGPNWGNLQTYPSDAKTNTASIVIAEHPYEVGKPRVVTVTIYIFVNKDNYFSPARQEQVLGTFTITI
ncbi:MAG: hypothetical protein FGM33_06435 [Candidatus Kapabacteria bacterium]|nr:hypothetical protein [Candidatus Kapabacteria bacterium]